MTRRLRVSGACWVAVIAVSAVTRSGFADEDAKERARAHVRRATAAYDLGHYKEAAQDFEAAYEQSLDPNMLFNVGQAWRMAGEPRKALTAYRSYIRNVPKSEQRALAEAKIRELEAQPPAQPSPASTAPAVRATPAAAPVATPTALPPALVVSPVPAPDVSSTSTNLAPAPATPATSTRPFYTRWPFWTAVGAALGAGVVTAIILGSGKDDLSMPATTYGAKRY